MLKSLRVQNFKSLVDFKIDFEPFTVLIGKNGSGKTTVLQALELLSAFLQGDVNHYLERRSWKPADLFSSFSEEKEMEFELCFEIPEESTHFSWVVGFALDRTGIFLTSERINRIYSHAIVNEKPLESGLINYDWKSGTSILTDEGSIMTAIAEGIRFRQSIMSLLFRNQPIIEEIGLELANIFLVNVQDSDQLRNHSRKTDLSILRNGGSLAGFIASFPKKDLKQLNTKLKLLIPQVFSLSSFEIFSDNYQLVYLENYPTKQKHFQNIRVWPEHISDGTLRIIALLATIQGAKPGTTLLLDEIENGIDPTQMGLLVQMMDEQINKKGIQVILSTHSPVALNYVPEEGIRYFKREADGNVKATNIFENGELKKMLEYMNAGEIWLNLEEKELLGGE